MIEPTDMNGSTSVKKFTSPVCGQRSFDSIWLPLATRTVARTRKTKGRSGQRDHKRCRSVTDASRARYPAVLRAIRGASRGVVTIRRATDWQSLMHFLHEPRLLTPELERGMAARHTHRQLQDSCGPPAYQPKHVETVGKSCSAISASPFRALSGLSLQFPLESGIALSIERSALSAPCLPGGAIGLGRVCG